MQKPLVIPHVHVNRP